MCFLERGPFYDLLCKNNLDPLDLGGHPYQPKHQPHLETKETQSNGIFVFEFFR